MISVRLLGVLSSPRTDLGSIYHRTPRARRKESEATVSRKGAGCGRSLLPLGAGPAPGAGADVLSLVESEQQITNDSLGTMLTKLTSQPKESWVFLGRGRHASLP